MKKLVCPFCKNDKDFAEIKIEEKGILANLCVRCGRVWINETEETFFEYNKDESTNGASLADDKE
jgi:transposase-like protein